MNDAISFSIPGYLNLTEENGWNKLDNKSTHFFVFRSHFFAKRYPVENKIKKGEIISSIEKPENVLLEKSEGIQVEYENIQVEETFKQLSFCKEFVRELCDELSGNCGAVEIGMQTSLKERLSQKYETYLQTIHTVKESVQKTVNVRSIFPESMPAKYYYVKSYQRYAMDIILVGIDYLYVNYETSCFGLRKKRKKQPTISGVKKNNFLKIGRLIESIYYWEQILDSVTIVSQENYIPQVKHPDELKIKMWNKAVNQYMRYDLKPSLYQLANAAFPLKWVNRKTKEWQREELLKLEEEDYKTRFGI